MLGLVAEGLTNREIAERLVISQNTAIRHAANIFAQARSRQPRAGRSGWPPSGG